MGRSLALPGLTTIRSWSPAPRTGPSTSGMCLRVHFVVVVVDDDNVVVVVVDAVVVDDDFLMILLM